jgi:hypothetical protein
VSEDAGTSQPPRLTLPERLALVYEHMDQLPPAATAREALDQLSTTLVEVEDEHSGVPANPNPGLAFDGRMYPPREDYIEEHPDGSITARTKGNVIEASADGALRILSRRTDEEVWRKAGYDEAMAAQSAAFGFAATPAQRLEESDQLATDHAAQHEAERSLRQQQTRDTTHEL